VENGWSGSGEEKADYKCENYFNMKLWGLVLKCYGGDKEKWTDLKYIQKAESIRYSDGVYMHDEKTC
jgi:hypothetical protein